MCGASVSSTFQSTLPLRGATGNQQTMQFADIFQSTLSVRRATEIAMSKMRTQIFQSTLSVRRATVSIVRRRAAHCSFQSTLSVRRATLFFDAVAAPIDGISIHALREESD